MPTDKADYVFSLLREIERIHPPRQRGAHHGILWEPGDEGDILILLICVGNAYWKIRTRPADFSDDPVETAARLVALIRDKIEAGEDNNPADYL